MIVPGICYITGEKKSKLIFSYNEPLKCEAPFPRDDQTNYFRQVWQYIDSKHLISIHNMVIKTNYKGDYVDATYKDYRKMESTFENES